MSELRDSENRRCSLFELRDFLYPEWLIRTRRKLQIERVKLSGMELGSKNYEKQAEKVRKLENKLFNQITYILNCLVKRKIDDKTFQLIYSLYQDYIEDVRHSVAIVESKGGDA